MAARDGLLEREATLAQLDLERRAVARGHGRVVLVRGEAGVGKTVVLNRFLAGLGHGVRVARGWCDPLTTPRPLGPLLDMLPEFSVRHSSPLRAAIDAGDIAAVYRGFSAAVAGESTCVCVIEDLHWADSATLDLLRFMTRRIDTLPLLLVASYRDDEVGDAHPVAMLLGDLATSRSVTRMAVDPLSMAAVARLAAGRGVDVAELHRLTGGNAFYVTEVLAGGRQVVTQKALPRNVFEAVWGRIARLSPAARDTLYSAAVCGPRAAVSLLHALCPVAERGLVECLNAGMLTGDGDTVGFRHELARRATLERIPDHHRLALHRRALEELSRPPVDPEALPSIVFHADRAGDDKTVVRFGPEAARRASTLGGHREATEMYELVLRHAPGEPAARRAGWLEQRAVSGYLSGMFDAALASFSEAAALRKSLGDPLGEGEDLRWMSHVLLSHGRRADAIDSAEASVRVLDTVGPSPQLGLSLINFAEVAHLRMDPRADAHADRALTLGAELGDAPIVARARCYRTVARVLRTDTGWDEAESAWRDAMTTDGLTVHAGVTGSLLCWTAAVHHQLDRADTYISEVLAYSAAHDLEMIRPVAVGAAACVALHRGRWDETIAFADEVLSRPDSFPLHRMVPLMSAALVNARRGEQPVVALLDEALAGADVEDVYGLALMWAARAEAAWLAGDDATARAEARTGLAAAALPDADPWLVGNLYRWVRLSGGTGDAATTVDTTTPHRLEAAGDWEGAVQEWTRLGCPYDAAVAELGGDLAAAERALETFRRLGATAASRRARQRIAVLRGRNPDPRNRATVADPHGLTPRERDVLALVAAGHSDAQIAATLFTSPKTANKHVGAILAKLGVRNRAQAAAAYAFRLTADAGRDDAGRDMG